MSINKEYLDEAEAMQPYIIGQESAGDPNAVSSEGARGLMQLMPDTAAETAKEMGLLEYNVDDPETNKKIGTYYYAKMLKAFNGDHELALTAYNQGPGTVSKLLSESGGTTLSDIIGFTASDGTHIGPNGRAYASGVLGRKAKAEVPQKEVPTMHADSDVQEAPSDTLQAMLGSATNPNQEFTPGTSQELGTVMQDVLSNPDFVNAPFATKMEVLKTVWTDKPGWDDKAKEGFGKIVNELWTTAAPNEKVNLPQLVGVPPALKEGDDSEAVFSAWQEEALNTLKEHGIDPILLGTELEKYFKDATKEEEEAFAVRSRGVVSEAVRFIPNVAKGIAQGFMGSATSTVSAVPRLFGFEETAESIDGIAKWVPSPDRELLYAVDDTGHIVIDEDGKPKTSSWNEFFNVSTQALGNLGFLWTGGALLKGAGLTQKAANVFIGGSNVLQTMDGAYKDAIENGGNVGEARLASFLSIPSAAVDTLGDIMVLDGGPAWIKGINNPWVKARAMAAISARKAMIEGGTEGIQQVMQDAGTSAAIDKNIIDPEKIGWAFVGGAVAGGVAGRVTADVRDFYDPANPGGYRTKDFVGPDRGLNVPPALKERPSPGFVGPMQPEFVGPQKAPIGLPNLPYNKGAARVTEYHESLAREVDRASTAIPALGNADKQTSAGHVNENRDLTIYATDTGSVQNQKDIASALERFKLSNSLEGIVRVKASDVTPAMLESFGLKGTVLPDGTLRVEKPTTFVPPVVDGTNIEDVEGKIKTISEDLARNSITDEEKQNLQLEQSQIKAVLGKSDERVKNAAPAHEQLLQEKERLEKEVEKLYAERKAHMSNKDTPYRQMINTELKKLSQQLHLLNNQVAMNGKELNDHALLTRRLKRVSELLKLSDKPYYSNDIKAKENYLKDLIAKRDVLRQELLEKSETAVNTDVKSVSKGLQIESESGMVTTVLPLQVGDRVTWHVLDHNGNSISQGFDNASDAINTALGVENKTANKLTPTRVVKLADPNARTVREQVNTTPTGKLVADTKFPGAEFEALRPQSRTNKSGFRLKHPLEEKTKTEGTTKKEEAPVLKFKLDFGASVPEHIMEWVKTLLSPFDFSDTGFSFISVDDIPDGPAKTTLLRAVQTVAQSSGGTVPAFYLPKELFGNRAIIYDPKHLDIHSDMALTVLTHEVGHAVENYFEANADEATKASIDNEFKEYLKLTAKKRISENQGRFVSGKEAETAKRWEDPNRSLTSSDRAFDKNWNQKKQEWLAQKYKDYALDPTKKPRSKAEKFFKKVGDSLRELFGKLVTRTEGKESFEFSKWLDKHYDDKASRDFGKLAENKIEASISPMVSPVEEVLNEFPPAEDLVTADTEARNIRARKLGQSIAADKTENERVREALKDLLYESQSRKAQRAKVEDITPENLNQSMRDVLDNRSGLSIQDRGALGVKVHEYLKGLTSKATTPEDIRTAADNEIAWDLKFAELGTQGGRFVDMLKSIGAKGDSLIMSKEAMMRKAIREITKTAEKTKTPLEDAQLQEIGKIISETYDTIAEAPESYLKIEKLAEMSERIRNVAGLPGESAFWFYWYGNILSGYMTQTVNGLSNLMNLILRLGTSVVVSPKDAPRVFAAGVRGLIRGASVEGLAVLKGETLARRNPNKYLFDARRHAPTVNFLKSMQKAIDSMPLTPEVVKGALKAGAKPVSKVLKPLEYLLNEAFLPTLNYYPFRLLSAVDAAFYRSGYEAMATLRAAIDIRKGGDKLTSVEFANRLSNELHNSDAEWKNALELAEADVKKFREKDTTKTGLKKLAHDMSFKNDVEHRAMEILDSRRSVRLKEEATRFAEEVTYTQPLEGAIGELAAKAEQYAQRVQGVKFIIPFTKIVANAVSESLDFTPIGMMRAIRGQAVTAKEHDSRRYSDLERAQKAIAGAAGTILGMSLLYLMAEKDTDKDLPFFAVYGAGPKDKKTRDSLKAKGWVPHSMKIGERYIKLSETPLNPVFAAVGQIHDLMRWDSSYKKLAPGITKKNWMEKSAMWLNAALIQGMGQSVLDMGFLRSVSNTLDVINGDKPVESLIASPAKGLVPATGFLSNINKDFLDPSAVDYGDMKAAWLGGVPVAQDSVKRALNGFGEPIKAASRFSSETSKDKVWRWMADNDLSVRAFQKTLQIGVGSNDSEKALHAVVIREREKTFGRFGAGFLTYDESYAIQKEAGPRIKARVERLVGTRYSKEKLQDMIDKICTEEMSRAKMNYLAKYHRENS